METIIELAKKGGYDPLKELHDQGLMSNLEESLLLSTTLKHQTVCDPLFWQALGRVCGWTERICEDCSTPYVDKTSCSCGESFPPTQFTWLHWAKKFHEINLEESWNDAVSWLSELTANQQED